MHQKRIWFGVLLVVAFSLVLLGCEKYDNRAFVQARSQDTLEAYQRYLSQYPKGLHIREARELIDDCAFKIAQKENTEPAYNSYITSYPQGRHIKQARELADQCAFKKAQTSNTLEAYEQYLTLFPDGLHKEEVKIIIQKLTEEKFQTSIKLLKDKDPQKRADAARALGKLKDARAVSRLNKMIDDESEDTSVRKAAGDALDTMKGAGITVPTTTVRQSHMRAGCTQMAAGRCRFVGECGGGRIGF